MSLHLVFSVAPPAHAVHSDDVIVLIEDALPDGLRSNGGARVVRVRGTPDEGEISYADLVSLTEQHTPSISW